MPGRIRRRPGARPRTRMSMEGRMARRISLQHARRYNRPAIRHSYRQRLTLRRRAGRLAPRIFANRDLRGVIASYLDNGDRALVDAIQTIRSWPMRDRPPIAFDNVNPLNGLRETMRRSIVSDRMNEMNWRAYDIYGNSDRGRFHRALAPRVTPALRRFKYLYHDEKVVNNNYHP